MTRKSKEVTDTMELLESLGAFKDIPDYKIELNDKDESLYYINPRTGKYKYLNKNKKLKKLLFSGLHYFKFKFFSDKPLLWTICIWFLCIGGIVVSFTGIGLSVKRIIRSSIFKK